MTLGPSAAHANSILNVFRNTAYAAITTVYVKMHTGDPGAAGTANASSVTTRNAITFAAASGGSMASTSIGAFTITGTETISHYSIWDASSAGNFLFSLALTTPRAVIATDTLTPSMTLSMTVAA